MGATHISGPLFVAGVEVIDASGNIDAPVTTTNLITSGNTTLGDAVTDTTGINGATTITTTSASGLTVGRQGATNPVLKVNAATATVVTGLEITGAAAAAGVALAAISSGTNENLTLDAKGSGTITLGSVSTGIVQSSRALNIAGTTAYNSGLVSVGTIDAEVILAVGANTGRVNAYQARLSSTGATVTTLAGCDLRVTDTGTAANVKGGQFVSEHSAGVSTGEIWGTNSISKVTGGTMVNAYGLVGDFQVTGTATVGTGTRNYATAGLFIQDVASTATLGTQLVNSAVTGVLVGNDSLSAAKAKATGVFTAIIGGDTATVTGGAAFKVLRHSSIAASLLDYGVDLYSAAGGGLLNNAFAVAEIRLTNATNIYSGTAVTRAAVRAQVGDSAPQGSFYIGSGSVATLKPNMYVKVLNASADTDWERVVTQAAD